MLEEFEKQYRAKYGDTRGLVERVFSSKPQPKLAMQIAKENPALYEHLRGLAEQAGFVGESRHDWVRRIAEVKEPAKPTRLDEDTQIARDQFSETEIKRIWSHQNAGSADNLITMKKSEPMKEYFVQLAAHSYGIASRRPVKPKPETKVAAQEPEATFPLAPDLCTKFNIREGTHVTLTESADLSVKDHAKRQAEAERSAALTPPATEDAA
jgi:hypothetical protein